MPSIRKRADKKLVGYQSLLEYRKDWYRIFKNARLAYGADSLECSNAEALRLVVDTVLHTHAEADLTLPGAPELNEGMPALNSVHATQLIVSFLAGMQDDITSDEEYMDML